LKSLIALWISLASDYARRCRTSATMDIKCIQGRTENEGLSFLTITLPSFGKEFRTFLDQGILADAAFPGFKRDRRGLPLFLGGFLQLIFDPSTGVLLDDPDIEAIHAVHQLTLMFSKIELPCAQHRVDSAMSGFVECESQVNKWSHDVDNSDLEDFHRMSRLLFASIFSELDKCVYDGDMVPRHGPGATADKLYGNSKYTCRLWTERLEKFFPAGENLFPSPSHYLDGYGTVDWLEPGDEIPVKVISVPKTLKTPRIIAIEPTCMQFAQQAILERLVPALEFRFSGAIGFVDQEPNQLMAREGSMKNGTLATLDLSDASDRVSCRLVETMMKDHPHLLGAVLSCRSYQADVPGHGVIPLAKFASMGSALTFPIEAMVFMTCVFLGIEQGLNTQFCSWSDIHRYLEQVRVYGDDIIVPVDYVQATITQLERFNAKVGASKSFWTGRFRESCGREYFDGHDISVVKVRQMPPSSSKDAKESISWVSTRNQFYMAGMWAGARYMDSILLKVLKYFPNVESSSPALGRISSLGYHAERECDILHRPLVKAYVVKSRLPINSLDGPGALLKFFLKRGSQPTADREHLRRSGRPRAVDIKPRWTVPY